MIAHNLHEINILGYSGSHLCLILETLYQLSYPGQVRIIQHDEVRYFDAPFDAQVNWEAVPVRSISVAPPNGLFFCSNKPSNKLFLFTFFEKRWGIEKRQFTSIAHPSSVVASTVRIEPGIYLEPLSVISPYAEIGFGVSINRACSIGHHNRIGDYSSIYPGANLSGDVMLGRGVTVGPGSTLFAGVTIGANSVIGGGSVVTRDIPENVLAYGNPCRVVKEIETLDERAARQTGIT